MNTYYLLGIIIGVIALVVQLAMLRLQLGAYRRHGHKSFLVLCLASVLALVYCVLTSVPYLVPLDMPALVQITAAGALIGCIGAVLAVWGTALLFKSYRELAEAA